MPEQYIGEVRMAGFNFAPQGWARCEGQLMSIAQNDALFAILGTTYGGDGINTFALPDLRGRVPTHVDTNFPLGLKGGEGQHTLNTQEMPGHTHQLMASTAVSHFNNPANRTFGDVEAGAFNIFTPPDNTATLAASSLKASGGSQPHNNYQPTLCINFIIALEGIFPSQN